MREPTAQEELDNIENQKAQAEKQIAMADRVMRLLNNVDFKAVIMDEFIVREAANLVHQSADPALKPEQRSDSLSMAQATGHLKRWLMVQLRIADNARDFIIEANETIAELRAEILNPSVEPEQE